MSGRTDPHSQTISYGCRSHGAMNFLQSLRSGHEACCLSQTGGPADAAWSEFRPGGAGRVRQALAIRVESRRRIWLASELKCRLRAEREESFDELSSEPT